MRKSLEQSMLKHIGFFSDFSYMYFHISFLVFGLKKLTCNPGEPCKAQIMYISRHKNLLKFLLQSPLSAVAGQRSSVQRAIHRETLHICLCFGDFSPLSCTGFSLATGLWLQDLRLLFAYSNTRSTQSAFPLAETNGRLKNHCPYYPFSYTALCNMLQMRVNATERFSLKSLQIPSLLAAAAVAAQNPVQAAELPTTPKELFFGVPELWLELRVFKTIHSALLTGFLLKPPPLKQTV